MTPFCLIILLTLVLTACSKKYERDNSNENLSLSTGQVISQIYRACKYQDDSFCDKSCCIINEKCGNQENGYRECNLGTGEWREGSYLDSECRSKCRTIDLQKNNTTSEDTALNEIKQDEYQETKLKCTQSWRCKDSYYSEFQISNCSFIAQKYCERGCVNGSCIPLCKPFDLICKNDVLRICDDDGEHYSFFKECTNGCENGTCVSKNETITDSSNLDNTINNSTLPGTAQSKDYITDKCVNASLNLTDEYFILKNTCAYSIGVTSWTVKDNSTHTFTFSNFILNINAGVTVHTGAGSNTSAELYWGRTGSVWNNKGDALYLRNEKNELILNCSYTQKSVVGICQ